jgi:hypothetical protein
MQKQQTGGTYLLFSALKHLKWMSLFIVECIEACKGEEPILDYVK